MIFDTKQHYKMYKKGKYWAFAAITLATVGLSGLINNDTTVHADTLNSEANTIASTFSGLTCVTLLDDKILTCITFSVDCHSSFHLTLG
ncbi:KxYKxGKxW signal peptide domain-containing protein [Lacticaseibacillus paracasei]|uniref:KxYKxGKxW signal peptide domain-containing protein n=1 Tax=Lacticaseibacillus paracasei TaxID=1597 RepID=UPI0021C3E6CF|nr:KxYKxGKxW signal peptide domain-containing protein [Lacticaseibacillus paracasei]